MTIAIVIISIVAIVVYDCTNSKPLLLVRTKYTLRINLQTNEEKSATF